MSWSCRAGGVGGKGFPYQPYEPYPAYRPCVPPTLGPIPGRPERDVAEYGSRIVTFKDGHIVSDKTNAGQRMAHAELTA